MNSFERIAPRVSLVQAKAAVSGSVRVARYIGRALKKAQLGCPARLSLVLVLLGLFTAGPAAASVVSINNASFETVDTTVGCTTGGSLNPGAFIATQFLGSFCVSSDPFAGTWSVSGVVGVWYPSFPYYPSGAPDGTNVAFANNGSISQILSGSTGTAGLGSYTLSAFIGGRCDVPITNYTVQLFAGSAPIASDSNTLVPSLAPGAGCGKFVLDTLTGNVTSSSLVGQSLEIVLSATGTNNTSQATFDDVTLTFQPAATTPEPGTLTLLGSGLLGLVHRLRRKPLVQS